jgi:hypothetical protein
VLVYDIQLFLSALVELIIESDTVRKNLLNLLAIDSELFLVVLSSCIFPIPVFCSLLFVSFLTVFQMVFILFFKLIIKSSFHPPP